MIMVTADVILPRKYVRDNIASASGHRHLSSGSFRMDASEGESLCGRRGGVPIVAS
jgi:hypothetical protein